MPFQIIRNDITKVRADAIVNTANPHPKVGGGTDSAVYRAAGEEQLLAERKKIGDIRPGDAAVTPGFALPAKYIIHTVGPAWKDGRHGEMEILRRCYRNSLEKAEELDCKSIAFPLIATGVYRFPKDEALQIALAEINRFLLKQEMLVILVVFDRKSFVLSEKLVSGIDAFLEEHEVEALEDEEYWLDYAEEMRRERAWSRRRQDSQDLILNTSVSVDETDPQPLSYDGAFEPDLFHTDEASGTLEEFLSKDEDGFRERLFRLIDERGLQDSEVYTRANITRQVFSKIRKNPEYHPRKNTAFALSIALELDMDTMLDLLSRAGFTFSPSSKTDLIIEYFVTNKNYDVEQIDLALFHYGQPTLFSEE